MRYFFTTVFTTSANGSFGFMSGVVVVRTYPNWIQVRETIMKEHKLKSAAIVSFTELSKEEYDIQTNHLISCDD